MGALHDNSGYNYAPSSAAGLCNVVAFGGTLTWPAPCRGGPDDKLGFAVGVGGIFKVPTWTGLTTPRPSSSTTRKVPAVYVVTTQPSARLAEHVRSSGGLICPHVRSGPPPCLRARWARSASATGRWHLRQSGVRLRRLRPEHLGRVGVNAAWDHLWTPNRRPPSTVPTSPSSTMHATAAALIADANLQHRRRCGEYRHPHHLLRSRLPGVDGRLPHAVEHHAVLLRRLRRDVSAARDGLRRQCFYTAAAGLPRNTGTYSIESQDTVSVTARAHWDILP